MWGKGVKGEGVSGLVGIGIDVCADT